MIGKKLETDVNTADYKGVSKLYNFIDTTEVLEGIQLPSEALKLNGEYIENLIPGYRTLNVKGRESLSPEVNTYETGIRDGSKIQNKRYPARTITITYQLMAESNETFRAAYNKLGGILDVVDAQLIFYDEQDKFFIGTPSYIAEVEPGRNAVIGEFEIICTDPFKYSLMEYYAEPSLDDSSILIDYNGTYKAYPILEAEFFSESDVGSDGETVGTLTGNGDCGFIAFYNEDEKIIQIGDPSEVDGTNPYAKSQTLVNQEFMNNTAWGTAAQGLWSANTGTGLIGGLNRTGSVGMKVASYAVPANPPATSGTLFNGRSDGGEPLFNYKVVARASGRTASSVKVEVSMTGSLQYSSSYFLYGYELTADIYIGGAWRSVKMKDVNTPWRGQTAHTVKWTGTISGLTADQRSVTGISFRVRRTDSAGGAAGILSQKACSNLNISPYVADVPETYYLGPTAYGSASGVWHGPTITRTLPADAAGEVGAKDFTLTYRQKMCIASGASSQMGAFQVQLTDSTGASVVGLRIVKNSYGMQGRIYLYMNGVNVHSYTVDLSYNNPSFGSKESVVKTSKIVKSGNQVSFYLGNMVLSYYSSPIAEKKVTKVTFAFEQYSSNAALSYNGLYWAKFVKDNCTTYKDIPNKFSADDVVTADCKEGDIFLNGILSPDLGALGNDWEEFYLTPGLNQIGVAYSDWVPTANAPKFKVKYREVFL